MRCTQFIGLPVVAMNFIKENCEKVPGSHCPHCGEILSYNIHKEKYKDASSYGMFDDGPILSKYFLNDGKHVFEEVQCAPWSSGPMIFLKLCDEEGKTLFEWSEDEISSY